MIDSATYALNKLEASINGYTRKPLDGWNFLEVSWSKYAVATLSYTDLACNMDASWSAG